MSNTPQGQPANLRNLNSQHPANEKPIRRYGTPALAILLLIMVLASLIWWLPISEQGQGNAAGTGHGGGNTATQTAGSGAANAGNATDATTGNNTPQGHQAHNTAAPQNTPAPPSAPNASPNTDTAQNPAAHDTQTSTQPTTTPDHTAAPVEQLGFSSNLNAAPPPPTPTPQPVTLPSTTPSETAGDAAGADPGLASFFGTPGRGSRFAFLIDRSGSMNGQPFQAARFELIKSIRALQPHEKFYVIFYDSKATPMPADRLVTANDAGKERAITWIRSMSTGGGTDPTEALTLALQKIKPDTIWLLSDGAFNVAVSDTLRALNPGARVQINTIAFYNRTGETILKIIADENDGDYRYVGPP